MKAWFRRWRDNRDARRLCEVVGALALNPNGAPALQIAATCGRPYTPLFHYLARLERMGTVESWWSEGIPRRRVYKLKINRGTS